MNQNLEAIKKLFRESLKENPGIASVYVFGSFVSGRTTEESDLDVGIVFQANAIPSSQALFDMRLQLSKLIAIPIDLVCLNTVSPILGMQVLRKGEMILNLNPHATNEYVIRLVNSYDDLKRVRKPIEEHLLKGRIYG